MIIGATRSEMSGGTTLLTRDLAYSALSRPSRSIACQSLATPYCAKPPQMEETSSVSGAPTRVMRSPTAKDDAFSPTAMTRPTLSWPSMPG